MKARIAVVDDEPRMAEVLGMVLRRDGHRVDVFTEPEALLAALDTGFDAVLTDLKMPNIDGVELLRRIREHDATVPVLLITAHATVATALAAMREGAFDYLEKPIDNAACRHAVQRALDHTRLARENRYLRAELASRYAPDSLLAPSEPMQRVLDLARRTARSRVPVLISGESGTGKELVARAIHFHSDRVGQAFVAANCKAFSPGVLESELFGHEKASFTGAERARAGLFERAHRGTLLLDELGEIDLAFQAKLLRVLQEGEVLRVGGNAPRAVDVRVLAATNQDLPALIEAGEFREDLYFRLAVVPIRIPPLRERRDDILVLARHFLVRAAEANGREIEGWSPEVASWMLAHAWPGNVRELENTIERGVVLARTETVELADLLLDEARTEGGGTLQQALDTAASTRIKEALAEAGGVRVAAARQLGVDRTTLFRMMRKYGIED